MVISIMLFTSRCRSSSRTKTAIQSYVELDDKMEEQKDNDKDDDDQESDDENDYGSHVFKMTKKQTEVRIMTYQQSAATQSYICIMSLFSQYQSLSSGLAWEVVWFVGEVCVGVFFRMCVANALTMPCPSY